MRSLVNIHCHARFKKTVFFAMRIFKTYFLSYFQMAYSITHYGYHVIYHVPMTYLKTGSLYLLSTFIHFTTTPYLLQPPIFSLDL